jgi:hypothetical protein
MALGCSIITYREDIGKETSPSTGHWISFNLPNSSSRTMALGSTQHLTEMNIRNLPGE